MKFWKTGASQTSTDPIVTDNKPTLLASAAIESVNLFSEEGVAVTSYSSGVVKTWGIVIGRCKSCFSTPVKGVRDAHLANGTLVVVWCKPGAGPKVGGYHIWDAGKGQPLRPVGQAWSEPSDLRVPGDGSKVFVLQKR